MQTTLLARRRRFGWVALAVAAGALLGGCASLTGPREVAVPLERLQRGLEQKFPLQQRALGVFELQLARPQVTVLRDNDRLALAADVSITSPLLRQAVQGSVSLSGRLLVDNVRNAVVLGDAHIDRFTVGGADERLQGQLTAAANVVAEKLVRDMPVYHFRPDELRYLGVQYVPTTIRTTADGLAIRFEPAK
ncbi:uncharacterized protein DUF1439 [Pseudoduganella lurida]|uniref:Uncharacterized protein DUF1439 n=1 Tax=Pseudoduganella lurida TaxID=1036180 RepID=A0A562RLH1_9BURK|nr:DUF1439 domain-containing protein [Pseudoduganella lurida]TWI69881.1 uncharacterized protein DUF1439 [Pseudoduganella lurida]